MLVESIANLVKEKKIEGLSDIEDHSSDRIGLRLEIFLKRDANPYVVLNQLYKYTRLQDSFSVNMLAIHEGKPKTMGLKEVLAHFITFQEEIVTRRTKYDLEKAEARMHILEGLRIALANIDEVIEVIRNSYDDARENLMARFGLSEIQAQSVLDMRLAQLQRLNGEKIEEEFNNLTALVAEYKALLADKNLLNEKIKEELAEIRDKFGDERKTNIENVMTEIDIEDLIEEEESVYTLTHFGYIKRIPAATYQSQNRGGKGIKGLSTRDEDFVENIIVASTHTNMLFFTDKGRMYRIKGYQIPEAGRQAKGSAIVNLLPIEKEEKVTAVISVPQFDDDKYLLMCTKNGIIKKTAVTDYDTSRKGGIIGIVLDEGDELIKVELTNGENDVIVGTHSGMAIRFNEKDVRSMGRVTRGVKSINLRGEDYVVGMCLAIEGTELLTVTENGYGKRTDISEYRVQSRAGVGIKNYKCSDVTGNVIGLRTVSDDEDILLITSEGIIIRIAASGISSIGRSTRGVRLMRLNEGVSVVSMGVTEHEEPEDETTEESSENSSEEVTE